MDVKGTLSTNPFIKREEIYIKSEVDEIQFEFCSVEKREIEETDTSSHSQNALLYTEETKCVNNLDGINQIKRMRHKRNSTEKQKRQYSREKRLFRCDECDYKSIRKGDITRHLLRHKDPYSQMQTYSCSKCDYKTIRNANLKQHQLRWHKDPSEVRVFKCNDCDYQSTRKDSLQQHQLRHKNPSDIDMHKCDQCKFETKHTKSLKQHQLSHKDPSEVRMFECGECDYKNILIGNLRRHQLTHKSPCEERIYRCDECDYKSTRKGDLKIHQLTHKLPSEVRTLKSDEVCDYKNFQNSNLEPECNLCEGIIKDENFKVIEDVTTNKFADLLTLSNETQNVMCTVCSSELQAALNFKSTCLDRDKCIKSYIDLENSQLVDLKEIYAKEKGSKQESRMLHVGEICRLCLQTTGNDHKSIQEVPVESLQIYIPEINFALTTDPVICMRCHDELCTHSSFIKKCLDVENKRETDKERVWNILFTDPCVKTEEIEIKLQQSDEAISEIISDINRGEPDIMINCMDEEKINMDVGDVLSTISSIKTEQIEIKSENDDIVCTLESDKGDTFLHFMDVSMDLEENKNLDDLKETKGSTKSEVQLNTTDYSNKKAKRRNSRKSRSKFITNGVKVREYQCYKCAFNTKRRDIFVRHQLIHKDPAEVQMFKCDQCGFKTVQKGNLLTHQLRHKDPSEVKTYECGECDYKSIRKGDLKRHQLRHKDPLEVLVFKCDACDYENVDKRTLRRHQLRHKDVAEVQVFSCDECNYRSIQKGNLLRHQLKHKDPSEVRTFKCEECDFKSIQKVHLKEHQLTHKDPSELPVFKCDECDYKAIRKGNLNQHLLRHKLRRDKLLLGQMQ